MDDTQNKQVKLLIIKESYNSELGNIVSLGKKLGWSIADMEENPELLLHLFYEYLDIIK